MESSYTNLVYNKSWCFPTVCSKYQCSLYSVELPSLRGHRTSRNFSLSSYMQRNWRQQEESMNEDVGRCKRMHQPWRWTQGNNFSVKNSTKNIPRNLPVYANTVYKCFFSSILLWNSAYCFCNININRVPAKTVKMYFSFGRIKGWVWDSVGLILNYQLFHH